MAKRKGRNSYFINYMENGDQIATAGFCFFDCKRSQKITKEHYEQFMLYLGNPDYFEELE